MKAYDYDACVFESEIYCNECLPEGVTVNDADPIFADAEWDIFPVCCDCGYEHDYVTKLDH